MLTLNYSTDPHWLTSKWIPASSGTYYALEMQIETNLKTMAFTAASPLQMSENNLPADHFTLSVKYSQGALLALVNPFRQQSFQLQLNSNSVIISSNISLSTCTVTITTPAATDFLVATYSSADRTLVVAVGSQSSFKCSFSTTSFVYGVTYYTLTPVSPVSLDVKTSEFAQSGLSIAIEGADSGCNIGASGSSCLLVYGLNTLATQQSATIHPGRSNTTYKLSYVFRNTFSQFRILISDLKQYEDQPVAYDNFIDNVAIYSLLNPE